MSRLFGTDGVRGLANEVITPALAMELAQAASIVLGFNTVKEGVRPKAVIAHDSRISGEFIGAAMTAGFAASGVDVLDAGMVPTPAAAYLVASTEADFGVMISASHNAAEDNGIKFLARGGKKLDDAIEDAIEALYRSKDFRYPTHGEVGRVRPLTDGEDRYVTHLVSTMPEHRRLNGLKVVLDCANGASSGVSPDAFRTLGAKVFVIGAEPDGININDGVGSTHPEKLQEAVVRHSADLGIAHDGDADRCMAVDEQGNLVDGDQIMSILALSMKESGTLKDDTLVATVMSSLGLEIFLKEHGIKLERTAVGDRYVLESMNKNGFNLGGEQSGHVIMSDHATTGDGVLTGLHLAAEMARTGLPLSELANRMQATPQKLINVKGVDRAGVASCVPLQEAIKDAEAQLGDTGRVLLRPSGTEPLVRVMVEAETQEAADATAQALADIVARELAI
ncbi:phosphoglucosamine mutase [Rothia nasimurium]|uniref:Phosphoglucosamine mutase n=1 Tax=Rothia nasimurium TaxID=85336 RepID=A0A4Y9F3P2_9MICC|nr:phosphoglucosamine mutase [Rothia nasimurium]MBF0808582.1 phosphoglucosamine mutase [Rothia nasimurium]TFU21769.1 phosphoglucosamine mutase [Rothia nasimurium]